MKKPIISPLVSQNTIRTKALSAAIRTVVTVMLVAAISTGCGVNEPPETTMLPTTAPVVTTAPVTEPPTAPPETTVPPETTAPVALGTKETPYPAGSYVVGKDIAPGDYVFLPDSDAEPGVFRLSYSQDVAESFYGQFFWSLKDGAKVEVENCHFFLADEYVVQMNNDGSYGPGMLRPGIDIPAGGYTINPISGTKPSVWYLFRSLTDPPFHNDYYRSSSDFGETIFLDAGFYEAILLENCTLTEVEEFIFAPPEAPTAQEITPLPESVDASTLVTSYYQMGVDIIGDGTYYISLPSIYPFSEAAVACQQEIYETVLPVLERYAEDSSYTDIRDTLLIPYENIHNERYIAGIGYDAYLYKNTLSIVVWEKNMNDRTRYYVFCLDISTGKRLSQNTMRSRADIGTEDIRQLLEAEFIGKWTGYPYSKEGADDLNKLYERQLSNITSDENVAKSQVFITDDGSIYVAANVYSLAGADYYPQLLPFKIAGPTTVEGYQALFDPSTEIGYMRQMALTSFYRYSSQVDLSAFFYTDFNSNELTLEEMVFLGEQGFELKMGVQCHSAAEMDAVLQAVCQIPLAHSNRKGLDTFTYFPATDSYYSNHNSSNFPDITITRFEDLGNDIVKLYYTCGNQIFSEYANQELVATVGITNDGGIRMISNQPQ